MRIRSTTTEPCSWRAPSPEELVKEFYKSLKSDQKEYVVFGWDDPRRQKISNNWEIVPQQIGKFYSGDQQQILKDLFRGLVSEDGFGRFQKQMKDDYGGFESYHVAVFGEPGTDKFEWVMTGRHITIRCDGEVWGDPSAEPEADVAAYELFRAIFSRRSRRQMRAWGGSLTDEQLDALCIFGPREDDQPQPV